MKILARACYIFFCITTAITCPRISASSFFGENISRWSPDCLALNGIRIKNESILLEVNTNQIYISLRVSEEKNERLVYLDVPQDLGRGGMMLPWVDFSKTVPIARITRIKEKSFILVWEGFFNNRAEKYEWTTEPDFYNESKEINFKKCSD